MNPTGFLRRLFRIGASGPPLQVVEDPPVACWERELAIAEAGRLAAGASESLPGRRLEARMRRLTAAQRRSVRDALASRGRDVAWPPDRDRDRDRRGEAEAA